MVSPAVAAARSDHHPVPVAGRDQGGLGPPGNVWVDVDGHDPALLAGDLGQQRGVAAAPAGVSGPEASISVRLAAREAAQSARAAPGGSAGP